jgi:hypothetical protein
MHSFYEDKGDPRIFENFNYAIKRSIRYKKNDRADFINLYIDLIHFINPCRYNIYGDGEFGRGSKKKLAKICLNKWHLVLQTVEIILYSWTIENIKRFGWCKRYDSQLTYDEFNNDREPYRRHLPLNLWRVQALKKNVEKILPPTTVHEDEHVKLRCVSTPRWFLGGS